MGWPASVRQAVGMLFLCVCGVLAAADGGGLVVGPVVSGDDAARRVEPEWFGKSGVGGAGVFQRGEDVRGGGLRSWGATVPCDVASVAGGYRPCAAVVVQERALGIPLWGEGSEVVAGAVFDVWQLWECDLRVMARVAYVLGSSPRGVSRPGALAGRFYPVWRGAAMLMSIDRLVFGGGLFALFRFLGGVVTLPVWSAYQVTRLVLSVVCTLTGLTCHVVLHVVCASMRTIVYVAVVSLCFALRVLTCVAIVLVVGCLASKDVVVARRACWRPWRLVRQWYGLMVVLFVLGSLPVGSACDDPQCQRGVSNAGAQMVGMGLGVLGTVARARFVGDQPLDERQRLCRELRVPAEGELGAHETQLLRALNDQLAELADLEGYMGPKGGKAVNARLNKDKLVRSIIDLRRGREQCVGSKRDRDLGADGEAAKRAQRRVDDVHPDSRRRLGSAPPADMFMDPAAVTVILNDGGGHCLYHCFVQALSLRDETATVATLRDALADYLSAHLDDAIGLYGSFEDAVWDAVRTGRMASTVHGYVGDLRTGKDSRGQVPYGGALEIELVVRVWPTLKVRVWAAPGDVLAHGQQYKLIAVYGEGVDVVDVQLSNSGTWASHYELMCVADEVDGGDRRATMVGDAPGDEPAGEPEGEGGAGAAEPTVEPSLCGSSSGEEDGGDDAGRAKPYRPPHKKRRGRVHLKEAPTHERAADRGLYEQGNARPTIKHSPAHTGFDRENAWQAAMDWVASQLDSAEWDEPPNSGLLDYVPVGARPLFQQLYSEMLSYVDKYPDDERRWFLLLRAWPALVVAPIRRGGGSATEQLLKRLEKWRDWRFEELYEEMDEYRQVRADKAAQSKPKTSRTHTDEMMYERASCEARDGYLSRAAALLSKAPLAITDEATWRGLSARCPVLGRARRWCSFDRDEPWVRISSDALKMVARSLKRSAALYTQPHHLRVVAIAEGGVDALLPVCERVLNGELPARAARWVYAQKVVALSKMSHHQADIEARVAAKAAGDGDSYEAPVRPIGVGDGFLRLAEKALCQQEKDAFRAHLMPYQVGVAVAGGLNMWCTVVECLLQRDVRNVIVAVDLANCFNDIDRDALVEELKRHPLLRPLARYVVATYPPGMISVTRINGEWWRLCTERGLAQGRPLSPVLASVLLQPCIVAAEAAMAEAQGCTAEELRKVAGIAAYLDDLTIVAHPAVAAMGMKAFARECSARGWTVNAQKTVCGAGYYASTDGSRHEALDEARAAFDGILPAEMVQCDGQVLLGTPLGSDSASVHVGSVAYRSQKLLDMTDAHDARLRSVVGLARRSGTTGTSTQRISVQLSQLLLRWCCNTRNVHLLRGVPARLVKEAAERHDQSVKVACAASLGFFDVTGDGVPDFLHGVSDASLPPAFIKAYEQVCLDAKLGGHGLRAWALHADAAFVGQWSLTLQSARVRGDDTGALHYPVLMDVIERASVCLREGVEDTGMPIVNDVASAWQRCVNHTKAAKALGLKSHNAQVPRLSDWLRDTEGDIRNMVNMPEQAQRVLSATVGALQVHEFERKLRADVHWDSSRRFVNWLANKGWVSSRWTQVVPWDRQGHLNLTNTAYVIAFCRRYRLERPVRYRGPDKCKCGWSRVGLGKCEFDGDHDECDCAKRQWARTLVHHTIVDALVRFLKDVGMVSVQAEYKYWDPARVGTDTTRRVPDVVCTHPHTHVEYVLDARIFWNSMSAGPGGYISYDHTGWGAEQGERQKQESWDEAIDRRVAMSANDVKFVPFSIEAGGVWGPAAQGFFNECLKLAGSDRNVDLYHWSSAKFSSTWYDTLSVLVAKGRAKVSVAASEADWSKRICEMQYADYEDHTMGS